MTATGRAEAERAERLIEHVLAALNATDPAGLLFAVTGAEFPEPEEEYRLEAEEIARRIRSGEAGGDWLNERGVAKIVRSVSKEWLEVRVPRGEARATATEISVRRVCDLVAETVAEEAALPLAEGRASMRILDDLDDCPAVELNPERETAARVLISIESGAQVTCMVSGGHAHEIYSPQTAEIAEEVRILIRALVAGSYYEEERDKRHTTTTKAFWPEGGSTTIDVSQDAGGPRTEWRRRAYDPY